MTRLGLEQVTIECSHSIVGGARPMSRFWASTLLLLHGDAEAGEPLTSREIEHAVDLLHDDDFQDLGLATVAAWGRRSG